MDLEQLTDLQVKELIQRLKEPKNIFSYNQINSKISTLLCDKIDINETILDDEDIEYVLHLYRGRIKATRFSIHLRFKDNHQHLIRLDADPTGRHENPDGTIITSSHLHIYSNQYSKKDAVAIPIEFSDFPNVQNIVDAFFAFEKHTNIKSR